MTTQAMQGKPAFLKAALGLCAGAFMLGAVASAAPPPMPDLDAIVSYETRQISKSGVTRVDTWQERMTRRDGVLWIEQVLPPGPHAAHDHARSGGKAGHRHLDVDTSARWIQRDPTGQIELRFVDKDEKVVVSIPKAEFGTVGFDGRWDAAAYIVPPDVVAKMKPAGPAADGIAWRAEQVKDWSHRVLWSDTRQVALRVESKRTDGTFSRTISVEPLPAGKSGARPWAHLSAYEQKKYDDYMD